MKSKTLSLKVIIKELVVLRKTKLLKNKKDLLLLANKLMERLPGPHNAKKHY